MRLLANVPAEHVMQSWPAKPFVLFPAGHAVQDNASDDPENDVNPTRQLEQLPEPADAAYLPATQVEQAV